MRTPIENHYPILLGTSEELVARTLGHSLHQYFVSFTYAAGVGFGRKAVLQSDDFIQTADLHLFRHIIRQMLAGIRTRTLGILEHKGGIITAFFHQGKGKPVVFFRLGMETGKYIRRQTAVGNDTADSIYTLQIPFTGILTVHQFQDTAASALHGQVDMLAHIGHFRNNLQGFIAHILGVRSSEADAYARCRLCYGAQQHRESDNLPVRLLKTVRVDILPQQGHFLIAFSHQIRHFIQDTFHITAAFPSARIGDDAVGTEVIATAHDGDKAGDVVAADTRRYHIAVGLRCGQLHVNGFLTGFHSRNQIGQAEISIRPHHQVDMVVRNQVVLDTFRHTSQHTDNQILLFLLERMKKLQPV